MENLDWMGIAFISVISFVTLIMVIMGIIEMCDNSSVNPNAKCKICKDRGKYPVYIGFKFIGDKPCSCKY